MTYGFTPQGEHHFEGIDPTALQQWLEELERRRPLPGRELREYPVVSRGLEGTREGVAGVVAGGRGHAGATAGPSGGGGAEGGSLAA